MATIKYETKDGVILEARDDVQAAAFENQGLKPVADKKNKD